MASKKKRSAKSGGKKGKSGRKKPGASAAGAGMKSVVLAIDADSDPVTKAPFDYREQNVYPYFEQKGFTVVRRQGAMARRARVTPEARKPEVAYLTGVGHGFNNSYTGNSQEPIFSKSSLSKKESLGKIVHFLSCKTAAGLGPSFVAHGCKAYFGYSDNFTYPPSLAEVFFECDSEIDRGFADGLTAGEVLQRVLARFQQHIDRLKATGDGGDLFNASVLEVDLRLLRAPSLEVGFGDPNARLSSD
ncbi:MAG TPA: hypothetical protein VGJ55_16295 [Pyrinomonadaceae bacterium]|jgi:hypothetical protein